MSASSVLGPAWWPHEKATASCRAVAFGICWRRANPGPAYRRRHQPARCVARMQQSLLDDRYQLGEAVQLVPFQCRIPVLTFLGRPVAPTAQASRAEVAVTSRSPAPAPLTGRILAQACPFQRRITALRPLVVPPTAQALRADSALT